MVEKRTVHTYCRICEPTCALIAEVDDHQKVTLRPDKSHPVHQGFACHKGLNFTEIHNDPDRLNHPLARRGGKDAVATFEQLDWTSAFSQIAARIDEVRTRHGDDVFGMYNGNPSAFNATAREGARRFASEVGVRYGFGSGTQDCANKFAASERVFGTANLHPIPDFAHTNYFLSIGSNPRISHMSFVHTTDPMGKLRSIVKRGGKVVHINPRRIESATPATGDVVLIKPDTDLYFLAALIHEMVANRWHDDAFLRSHGSNVDEMLAFVSQYPAERVADVTGIPADTIRTIAREFTSADGASVHCSTGINMGRQGTLAYWLVQMLSLVSGNLGQRGGNLYSPGYFTAAAVGKPKGDDPFFDTEFGQLRTITGSLPGNLLADYIEAGKVKALFCMSGNPVLSMGGESRLRRALAKLELLVVIDIYPNATSAMADFVLPATDWLEREDVNAISVGFHPEPYVQYTPAVVDPIAERKPEWWIYSKLAAAIGGADVTASKTFNPLSRVDRQLTSAGLSLDELKSMPGHVLRLPDPEPEQLYALGVQTGDKHVDCCPALFALDLAHAETLFNELAGEDANQLKLITLRTNYMVNSWYHNAPSLKRDNALDNPLHMNPVDAERLRLQAGAEIRVSNQYGSVIAMLKLDETLRPGVVAMTHGWGHGNNKQLRVASNHPGVNVNELLPTGVGSFERLSNQSHMTGIPVEVALAG